MKQENLEKLKNVIIYLTEIEVKGKQAKVFGSCIEALDSIYATEKQENKEFQEKTQIPK